MVVQECPCEKDPEEGFQRKDKVFKKTIVINLYFDGTLNNLSHTKFAEYINDIEKQYQLDKENFAVDKKQIQNNPELNKYAEKFEDAVDSIQDSSWWFWQSDWQKLLKSVSEGSSANALSNVAEAYYAHDKIESGELKVFNHYIEGIGTNVKDLNDPLYGKALGMGKTGVIGKVLKGVSMALGSAKKGFDQLKVPGSKLDLDIVFNVFGFSRGAAAARYFCYCAFNQVISESQLSTGMRQKTILSLPDEATLFVHKLETSVKSLSLDDFLSRLYQEDFLGTFNNNLSEEDSALLSNAEAYIGFLGIFDTVASYGLVHSNDVKDLHLDDIYKYTRYVAHFCAAEEYRENFRLTTSQHQPTHNRYQFYLPGAHSDVGGGYKTAEEKKDIYAGYGNSTDNIFDFLTSTTGWFSSDSAKPLGSGSNQIGIDEVYTGSGSIGISHMNSVLKTLKIHRKKVSREYARVPLHLMIDEATESGMKFNLNEHPITNLSPSPSVGIDLKLVYEALRSYCEDCKDGLISNVNHWQGLEPNNIPNEMQKYVTFDLARLRNAYLHFSGELSLGMKVNVNANNQMERLVLNGTGSNE